METKVVPASHAQTLRNANGEPLNLRDCQLLNYNPNNLTNQTRKRLGIFPISYNFNFLLK